MLQSEPVTILLVHATRPNHGVTEASHVAPAAGAIYVRQEQQSFTWRIT